MMIVNMLISYTISLIYCDSGRGFHSLHSRHQYLNCMFLKLQVVPFCGARTKDIYLQTLFEKLASILSSYC